MAQDASPCSKAEHRHLDFWLGEWDVMDKENRIATSRIERAAEGCFILENYSQLDGYHGASMTFYDAVLGRWRQTWVDSRGNVGEFVGAFQDRTLRLEGETHRRDGTTVLRRMTLDRLGPDQVRQFSQRSLDGGKNWGIAYDFIYRRRSERP